MAKVTKSDAARVLPVLKMRVGVAVAGAGFRELTGASLVDHTSGSRSVSQVPTLRGPGAVPGAKSVENVTFDLAAVQPHLAVMDDLDRADRNQLNLRVRMDIYSRVIRVAGTATASIAQVAANAEPQDEADGAVVSFPVGEDDLLSMFTNDEILVGDILQVGATDAARRTRANSYIVNRIEADDETGEVEAGDVYATKLDGSKVDGAVAAAIVAVRTAGWRQEFAGTVNQFGSIQGDASGSPSLSSGVVFTPHALLPRPIVLLGKEGDTAALMGAPIW